MRRGTGMSADSDRQDCTRQEAPGNRKDLKDSEGNVLVTAYAVRRPDENWSLMLVNRDENNAHPVHVVFENSRNGNKTSFSGPITFVTFGSEQYAWINDGPNSHADPDHPPWLAQLTEQSG